MRKYFALLFLFIFTGNACNKEKEAEPMQCQLETIAIEFEAEQIEVTYTLEASGDYVIHSYYYYDESGRISQENPTVPQTITVTLNEQKRMQAGATGEIRNGVISVSFQAVNDTVIYEGSDRCQQISQ